MFKDPALSGDARDRSHMTELQSEVVMVFTTEQSTTWKTLYGKLLPRIQKHACGEYLRGFDLLGMIQDEIPSIEFLNGRITPATGWQVVRTSVRYSDAVDWYNEFSQKHFLVTDYIRSWEELDFTPEPDMFHDIFGHLPFMTLPEYAELEELFAPAFLRATDEQRENIKRLAWYSTGSYQARFRSIPSGPRTSSPIPNRSGNSTASSSWRIPWTITKPS
jgi:phenylalanine-4-hydroxylase